jgi:hypothetical protein
MAHIGGHGGGRAALLSCIVAFVAGCGGGGGTGAPDAHTDDGGVDTGVPDTGPGDGGGQDSGDGGEGNDCVHQVDLLLVVDSSASMGAEQPALVAELPALLTTLGNGNPPVGELGHDPDLPAFEPVDLHVGVITVDMGLHDQMLVDSLPPNFTCDLMGDDGIMRVAGQGCAPSLLDAGGGRFLRFVPGETNAGTFVDDAACLAAVGFDGCFIEQQLEAVLKALTPSNSSIGFFGGPGGQGNPAGANAGFVRDGSVAVVILVTDEDDCSLADPSLNREGTGYPGEINPRCFLPRNASALHPLTRYVDGLAALRPGSPGRVIFSLIAGMPTDLVRGGAETQVAFYDRVLADSRMQLLVGTPGTLLEDSRVIFDWGNPIVAPTDPTTLTDQQLQNYTSVWPTCIRDIPGTQEKGIADPAIRLVRAARAMEVAGVQTLVSSICKVHPTDPARLDFSAAFGDIRATIATTVATTCPP